MRGARASLGLAWNRRGAPARPNRANVAPAGVSPSSAKGRRRGARRRRGDMKNEALNFVI